MFLLYGKPLNINTPLLIDGIQYPAGYFKSFIRRTRVGIVEVPDPVRPDERYNFVTDNGDGTFTATPKPASMLKAQKIAEINAAYVEAMQVVKEGYPEDEIKTWTKQETQASAFLADPSAVTPFLDSQAAERGIDKADLAERIMQKVQFAEVYIGSITGKRQRLEDAINAVPDDAPAEALDAIHWNDE